MPQQGRILRDETRASQSAADKGHFTGLEQIRGRLLAWIGDQVRLKASSGQPRAFYIHEEAQPRAKRRTIEKGDNKKGAIGLETIVV